jgi:nicotinate-nucleotide adenylyltransferase
VARDFYIIRARGKKMRTGIFGGTFDPIHNGHLLSAAAIKDVLKLDKIVFIPTGEPPHKVARRVTPSEDRLAMVKLAVEDNENFEVSDIECRRNNYTYTYDTLKELNE